jgi:uncharacterized protein (DUF1800 family)
MSTRRAFFGALSGIATSAAGAATAGAQERASLPITPMTLPAAELKLLRRITNGPTLEDIAAINSYGYNGYIDMQLNPAAIDDSACDTRLAPYTTLANPTPYLYTLDSNTVQTQLIESTILRAVYSKRQLFERMVEFWTDHFNTDITTVGILKTQDVRDVIRHNTLGSFLGMLNAQATSPAMINRLNNQQNSRTSPNQNYAREVMELHTLGVTGGYTQQDIVEVARCFTGWRYITTTGSPSRGLFQFNQNVHDTGTKTVLGHTITSAGVDEGLLVLRILADQPATHRFLAKKLLRWFIDYEPSEALIADVAEVFRQSQGDIKTVVRRVLDAENIRWAPPLFKRPFHYIASGLRAMNANMTRYDSLRFTWLSGMGQIPFQWNPPNGYPHSFEYWGTLVLPRWNFAFSLPISGNVGGATVDLTALLAGANTAQSIANRIDLLLFGGEMPPVDKAALVTYIGTGVPSTTRIRDAFGLALASPGFQWY